MYQSNVIESMVYKILTIHLHAAESTSGTRHKWNHPLEVPEKALWMERSLEPKTLLVLFPFSLTEITREAS